MRGHPRHNTRPHFRLSHIFLGLDDISTERNFDSLATWIIDVLCFFDMLSMGVCSTRHRETPGRLVQELNVCTVFWSDERTRALAIFHTNAHAHLWRSERGHDAWQLCWSDERTRALAIFHTNAHAHLWRSERGRWPLGVRFLWPCGNIKLQVVILNSALRYWMYKVWTAPGLTPIDQSASSITAEQVIKGYFSKS